jgi:FeS assembly SUF system regulator
MLRISKLADYAVVIISTMIKDSFIAYSATQLVVQTGLNLPTVRKILKQLTAHEILKGTRGVEGGYTIIANTEQLSIADVVEAIDGPISLTDCSAHDVYQCATTTCTMKPSWSVVNRLVRQTLVDYKIKTLAQA